MADGLSHNRKASLDTVTAQISGAHTDFPVLFTDLNLPSEIFDSDGSFPAQNGGGDIRFTSDSAGTNLLPVEVVSLTTDPDPANGRAQIWVKLPNVRGTQVDTVYIWYNTPSSDNRPAVTAPNGRNAVWSGYRAVYHLLHADRATDATGNGHTLVDVQGDFTARTGPFGSDVVDYTSFDKQKVDGLIDGQGDITASIWADLDSEQDRAMFGTAQETTADGMELGARFDLSGYSEGGTNLLKYAIAGSAFETNNNNAITSSNEWQLIHVRRSGGSGQCFVDGNAEDSGASPGSTALAASTFYIGTGGKDLWDGGLAECRVSDTALTADWIATEYNNQNDPGAFISTGTPQDVGGGAIVPVDSAEHDHAAGAITLVQQHGLTFFDAVSSHSGETVLLSPVHALGIAAAAHGQAGQAVDVTQFHFLDNFDGAHSLTADVASVSQVGGVSPEVASLSQIVGAVPLLQSHMLAIAGDIHPQMADKEEITILGSAGAPQGRVVQVRSARTLLVPGQTDRALTVGDDRSFPIPTNQ